MLYRGLVDIDDKNGFMECRNLVVICSEDSAAARYAEANGIARRPVIASS